MHLSQITRFFHTTPLVLSLILLSAPLISSAQEKSSEKKAESGESDKLDIQKLEQKYWSAKDDDFTVIQNRAFSKEKRWYLSLNYGAPYNDPNSSGNLMGVNVGYYFSERWGLEFNYNTASYKFNDTIDEYKTRFGVVPDHNTYKGAMTLMGYWVPIYAKMSFLDKKIIYFDMGLGFGLGNTTYSQNKCSSSGACNNNFFSNAPQDKTGFHYSLNIMQQFFINQNWAFRVDFINRWTTEDRLRFSTGESQGSKQINDTALQLGVTFWK